MFYRIRNDLSCYIVLTKQILETFKLNATVLKLFQSAFVTPIDDWSECVSAIL